MSSMMLESGENKSPSHFEVIRSTMNKDIINQVCPQASPCVCVCMCICVLQICVARRQLESVTFL